MKKYYKLSVAVIAITALFQFSGCQDEIFNEIRDEIKLEDSTVSGHINSIIRFNPNGGGTEYIAIQNGGVYYRNAAVETETDWTKDSRTAGQVSKIAADKEYIYALYTDWKEDLDEGEWVRNSTSIVCKNNIEDNWTKIYTVDSNTNVNLFCTNAKKKGMIGMMTPKEFDYVALSDVIWIYKRIVSAASWDMYSGGSLIRMPQEDQIVFYVRDGRKFAGLGGDADMEHLFSTVRAKSPMCKCGYRKEWEKELS